MATSKKFEFETKAIGAMTPNEFTDYFGTFTKFMDEVGEYGQSLQRVAMLLLGTEQLNQVQKLEKELERK